MPLADCWQEFLALCCFLCTRDIDAPEGAELVSVTIQDVSGCPCIDGATFFSASEAYDAFTPFCSPGITSFAWTFDESAPQCLDPPVAEELDHLVIACCGSGPDSYLYIDFQYGHTGSVFSVFAISPHPQPSPFDTATELTVVSFSTSPFELVVEADMTAGSTSCNPGRLRFIFTRS